MPHTPDITEGAAVSVAGVVKSAPPVAVTGLSLAGVPLSDWVLIATLGWIGIQAGWFVWTNIVKPYVDKRGKQQ
jgi:hypothetical protein